jgi:periplasmic protein TonB
VGLHGPVNRAAYTMEVALSVPAPVPAFPRNVLIAGVVLALHVAVLWALQSGLLRRVVEVVVPVQVLSTVMAPPAAAPPIAPQPVKPLETKPVAPPRKVAPAPAPKPVPAPVPRAPMPVAPTPVAPAAREPAPQPATATSDPQPASPVAAPATAAVPATPAPAPTAGVVRLPSTSADYLHNPPPQYPPLSQRLREEGTSVVKVLIGTDGRVQEAQIAKSSGFPRLDQAAEVTARGWRYVPGTRGGVPEPMWVEVPIVWQYRKE